MNSKKRIDKLFEFIAHFKVYFSSSGIYISVINFILILATFKLTYKIEVSAFILVPLGFILVLLLGFLDYSLIMKYQTEHINKKNDIKIQLSRIETKLDKILEVEK